MSTILEVTDLHANIENTPVLNGVSFSVGEGELVALIGRNGAGKTTTFRAIWGTVAVTSGDVAIRGDSIVDVPTSKRERYGMSFAPEDLRLFHDMSVMDNFKVAAWAGNTSTERFEELLDQATDIFPDVQTFLHRPVDNLSGGQQRMVAVSRALMADPDLILLDEPFEGLAPSIRKSLREGITQIKELNITILLAESKINHARDVANRFYVIERGETIETIESRDALDTNETVARTFGLGGMSE